MTALVTGGESGIGEGIVHRLLADGYDVAIVDLSPKGAETARAFAAPEKVRFIEFDITQTDDLGGLLDEVRTWRSLPAALGNNAGVTQKNGFLDVTADDWDRMFAVNARASFLPLQRWAGLLAAERTPGAAINIASLAGKGWIGRSNVAYASSKGAVLTMTRVAARQLAPLGIRVNAVCPGLVDTDMLRSVISRQAELTGSLSTR